MMYLDPEQLAQCPPYPESEYSRQRADTALKLGGREEKGKERIV